MDKVRLMGKIGTGGSSAFSEELGFEESDNLLLGLDESQLHAVTVEASPLAIIAGAGSGKTRVLTRRIAWRAMKGKEDPRRVLALTFTRKAAGELRSRLSRLGLRDQIAAGTFHSVAYSQLRIYWQDRGIKEPTLLTNKISFVTNLLPRDKRSTDTLDIVTEIEWAKARRISPETYFSEAEKHGRTPPLGLQEVSNIFKSYEELKAERKFLDFDDLLSDCAKIIRSDRSFGEAQKWRFRNFYVDEFQDVNPLQFSLLAAWLDGRPSLCVVGDPNQAIYAWNGAEADHLVRFEEHFRDSTVVSLNKNYRSTPQIVETASCLLENSGITAVRGGGLKPSISNYSDEELEAEGIAKKVNEIHTSGQKWSDQAILVRTNAQTEIFTNALREEGIPVKTVSGSGLLDRKDIKIVISELTNSNSPLIQKINDLDTTGGEGPSTSGGDETTTDTERTVALAELRRLAEEYLALDPAAKSNSFVLWLKSQSQNLYEINDDAVEISTFHRSKGLEWPVVHVAGLEQGLVPIAHAKDSSAVAEERRLLYVALTRAKDRILCSWANNRHFSGNKRARDPSPWLFNIERAIQNLEKPLTQTEQITKVKSARRKKTKNHLPETQQMRELKEWRLSVSRAADVPAFVIFNDETLLNLLEVKPTNLDELLKIKGIGPVKAERYGKEILELVSRHY
ncbi:MAG: ATP-dependent DNA helicase UvrD2 [Actinomycetota bacterium]|nr:ATP-dependent DNA helicase UvrD2 [Actinomycetota bacterium]